MRRAVPLSLRWRMNQVSLSTNLYCQAEDVIRDLTVTGVQTCALPISRRRLVFASRAVLQHDCRARPARQQAVEGPLQPGCPQTVVPQAADGRARDGGIGIEPVERSEERRVGESVDLRGRRIIIKKRTR